METSEEMGNNAETSLCGEASAADEEEPAEFSAEATLAEVHEELNK